MPTAILHALDTVFFRDGRPFSMGDDSFAQGVFPPPPSVLYGALRSCFIAKGLEESTDLHQSIDESSKLRIQCIAFDDSMGSQYFPLPKDLIVPTGLKPSRAQLLVLEDGPEYSSCQTPMVLKSLPNILKTEEEPYLIDSIALQNYLDGLSSSFSVKRLSEFISVETKVGIGRNKETNTVEEGKLYKIQTNRMSNANGKQLDFSLGYCAIDLPEDTIIPLGGEGRVAQLKHALEIKIDFKPPESIDFKIYLSTPAIFQNGWKPENILNKFGLELLAVASSAPLHLGGWDIRARKPKPMLKCVPAGTVYYVKAETLEMAKLAASEIHGKAISDNINQTDYCAMGFGIAFIGKNL